MKQLCNVLQGPAFQADSHYGRRFDTGKVRPGWRCLLYTHPSNDIQAKVNGCLHWLWSSEAHYGRLLAPYLDNAAHAFIISSDFCHWGTRFNYLFYERSRARTLRITFMAMPEIQGSSWLARMRSF